MEKINKFLTEAMGQCWHTHTPVTEDIWGIKCDECGIIVTPNRNNDFLTWEGFGRLWPWANEQKWWIDFILTREPGVSNFCKYIEPVTFAKAVVDFLQKK